MKTEVEMLAELHLWLAWRLPELRREFLATGIMDYQPDVARGWVPNVTTDGLLEALRAHKYMVGVRTFTHLSPVVSVLPETRGVADDTDGFVAPTVHGALCHAAKAALEADE